MNSKFIEVEVLKILSNFRFTIILSRSNRKGSYVPSFPVSLNGNILHNSSKNYTATKAVMAFQPR
jgi:hypothetical protein